MIKTVLFGISLALAVAMYVPLFGRILRRKHTRDFSKAFSWMLVMLQINGGLLALAERAPFLVVWYILQTTMCSTQLFLVYKYWNWEEPKLRGGRNVS